MIDKMTNCYLHARHKLLRKIIHTRYSGFIILLFFTSSLIPFSTASQTENDAYQIFDQRVRPISNSSEPSSCSDCHLSNVDLKDYILESAEETFFSMQAQGWINIQQPMQSKILDAILKAPTASSDATEEIRQREWDAFSAWIKAATKSEKLTKISRPATAEIAPSSAPIEVIRHTLKDRVYDSFVTNVWNQLGTCARCHSSRNPKLDKWAEKYGPNIQWCLDTAAETFRVITERGLADVDYPEDSFILQKPTMQIKHVGGQRMEVGDRQYKLFRQWLEDYAAVVNGEYESVDDLPTTPTIEFIGSRIFLELIQIPEAWVGKRISVFIFLFDEETGKFFPSPVAEASARVLPTNKHWNRSLTLRGPKGSPQVQELKESHRLPEGRYLLKIFCDVNEELKEDWEIPLMDQRFYVGQLEITTRWRVRWKRAMIVNLSEL